MQPASGLWCGVWIKQFRAEESAFFMNKFLVNTSDVQGEFDRLASLILFGCVIKTGAFSYRIVEIEFYFYCKEHPDGFTHSHEMAPGCWRVHRSGLDITLCGLRQEAYGGILIRSVRDMHSKNFINGPVKVFYELMNHNFAVEDPGVPLQLMTSDKLFRVEPFEPLKTHRIGIFKPQKQTPLDNAFIDHEYRYIICLEKENKVEQRELTASKISDSEIRTRFLGYSLSS